MQRATLRIGKGKVKQMQYLEQTELVGAAAWDRNIDHHAPTSAGVSDMAHVVFPDVAWGEHGIDRRALPTGVADLGRGDYGLDAGPFRDGRSYPLTLAEGQE